MPATKTLRSLVREAELYRSQGLLTESRARYRRALEIVKKAPPSPKHKKIMDEVTDRIRVVEKDLTEVSEGTKVPKLAHDVHCLIKQLFSFSQTREAATLEGAMALAKFGQYDQALAEFNKLLESGTLAVPAAKNILRCHMTLCSPDAAVSQFKQWVSRGGLLSQEELKFIRSFLEDALDKSGVHVQLPQPMEATPSVKVERAMDEETLEITGLSIRFTEGELRGQCVELDSVFQLGSVISVVVKAYEAALLETLVPGSRLSDVQFYSPITVFRGSCTVSRRSPIKEGPNQGDIMVDIAIEQD